MSSLAVKYRPKTFDEVVGQDETVQILRNMLNSGEISSAYIFAGGRGTGKTTIARLLAKCLNCQATEKITDTPCNECSSCREIDAGVSLDLVEIDAASNRGIDSVRQLQSEAIFCATYGYKIMLLDEAHMMTKEAFNALLKIIEEPPANTIFVLATTEIAKLPKTIQSRCQKHTFKNVSPVDMVKALARVIKAENISIDKEAVFELARSADGSVRDALFYLEQLHFLSPDKVTVEDVETLCIQFDLEISYNYISGVIDQDIGKCFFYINKYLSEGGDAKQLIKDCMRLIRSSLIMEVCDDYKQILKASEAQYRLFHVIKTKIGAESAMRMLTLLQDTFTRFEYGMDEQIVLEIMTIKLFGG